MLSEETGLLCPPRDAAAFTAAVRRLVEDAALRDAMGAAAHERAQAYSWPRVLRRMLDEYRRLAPVEAAPVLALSEA